MGRKIFGFTVADTILIVILFRMFVPASEPAFIYEIPRNNIERIGTHAAEIRIDSSLQNFNHGNDTNQRRDANGNDRDGEVGTQTVIPYGFAGQGYDIIKTQAAFYSIV